MAFVPLFTYVYWTTTRSSHSAKAGYIKVMRTNVCLKCDESMENQATVFPHRTTRRLQGEHDIGVGAGGLHRSSPGRVGICRCEGKYPTGKRLTSSGMGEDFIVLKTKCLDSWAENEGGNFGLATIQVALNEKI